MSLMFQTLERENAEKTFVKGKKQPNLRSEVSSTKCCIIFCYSTCDNKMNNHWFCESGCHLGHSADLTRCSIPSPVHYWISLVSHPPTTDIATGFSGQETVRKWNASVLETVERSCETRSCMEGPLQSPKRFLRKLLQGEVMKRSFKDISLQILRRFGGSIRHLRIWKYMMTNTIT
jgi:hypothetical protein